MIKSYNPFTTMEDMESKLKEDFRRCSEYCEDTKGYMSTASTLNGMLNIVFGYEDWNERNDCPATFFTNSEYLGVRYYLYSFSKKEFIDNPIKKEEALAICEKILNSMVKKGLVVFSKSGKGVKYIGQ